MMIRNWLVAVSCVCAVCLFSSLASLPAEESRTAKGPASAEAGKAETSTHPSSAAARLIRGKKDTSSTRPRRKKVVRIPDPEKALKKVVKKANLSGTFRSALLKCRKLCGVPMKVDWAGLRAAGVKADKKVVVKAPSATVEQLLELTLARAAVKGHPLGWYIDGQTICVTTQRRVLARRLGVAMELSAFRRRRGSDEKRNRRKKTFSKFDFKENKLSDVVEFLRGVSGVNFFVDWRALKLANIDRNTLVTFKLSNVTVARTLDVLTDTISTSTDKFDRVYWVIDEGMVRISTGSGLDTKTKIRVFDVADLLMVMPKFKAFRSGSSSSVSGKDDKDDDDDDNDNKDNFAKRKKRQEDKLIALIKSTIGDDMWQPDGKGSIHIIKDRLVVSQTLLGFKLLAQATRR